jgi:adenosylcobinamide-GDP ribazoletransferase
MADPRLGAFGTIALVVVLGLRVAALAATPARILVVAGLWCGSRTLMAVVVRVLPSARADGGSVTALFGLPGRPRPAASLYGTLAYGSALAVTCVLLGGHGRGALALAAEAASACAVVWFACRRLGGYTGDVLGACGVIGETVGLLVLAAR